jgi:hypothetical protein
MGAGPKVDASFHMMQAGLLPGRQFSQSIFPINDPAAFAFGNFTFLTQLVVFSGGAPHGPIKSAGLAVIIDFAQFAAGHPGLHPDAGMAVFRCVFYFSMGFHIPKPCPNKFGLLVIGYKLFVTDDRVTTSTINE